MKELDDEGNALDDPVTAAEIELCPEKRTSTVCRVEAPQRRSVNSFPAKKGIPSSPSMRTGRQSRKLGRSGKDEAGVGAGQESSAKPEDITDATPADFGALQSEAGSTSQVL